MNFKNLEDFKKYLKENLQNYIPEAIDMKYFIKYIIKYNFLYTKYLHFRKYNEGYDQFIIFYENFIYRIFLISDDEFKIQKCRAFESREDFKRWLANDKHKEPFYFYQINEINLNEI